MHGVGTGSTLDGRYVLERRIQFRPTFERWTAKDQTLQRPVVLLCLSADLPQAPAVLDAARRAAALDDPRLVRVHAVGRDRMVAFIVESDTGPAEPLSTIFRARGVPAHEVRRLVGESASALEIARARGLHHLALTPADVLRRPDASIVIRGLETKAALLGLEPIDSDRASRTDAVALVALAYAGLTTRWPLPEAADALSGLEQAPRFVAGIPAPSEIAAGVPADLDVIARQTFGSDLGPLTPGDLARQIAPWSQQSFSPVAVSAQATNRVGSVSDSPAAADEAAPDDRSGEAGTGQPTKTDGTGQPTKPGARTHPGGAAARNEDSTGAVATLTETASATPSVAAASLAATSEILAKTGTRLKGLAKSGADRWAAARTRVQENRDVTPGAASPTAVTLTRPEPAVDDRPLSILPESTGLPPTGEQSRLALAIVAGFLLIATVLAVFNLPGMGVSRTATPVTVAGGTTPTLPSPAPTTTAPPAPLTPLRIQAALGFDPQGDGTEGNDSAARALDASATTSWRSEGYASTSFGGLKKGVGLALDLGHVTPVNQVVLTLPARQDFTVYAAPRLSLTDAVKIGSGTKATGQSTVTVTGNPPDARYVIIWVTRPAADSHGRFRAQISDVVVR